jgi:hypothetical protein
VLTARVEQCNDLCGASVSRGARHDSHIGTFAAYSGVASPSGLALVLTNDLGGYELPTDPSHSEDVSHSVKHEGVRA